MAISAILFLEVNMKKTVFALVLAILALVFAPQTVDAAVCTPTGYSQGGVNLTAALINPGNISGGEVDATGCHIGIYYGPGSAGTVRGVNIHGATYYGIFANGDADEVTLNVYSNWIHSIGENPHNGAQHGVAVYGRAFFPTGGVTMWIVGNTIEGYQKGGIVVNGMSAQATVSDNTVTGDGPVNFIAMNGIQIGYGASAAVMRNTVSGNSYIGFPGDGSASGGIIVVGGPGYGMCPDGNQCPYTVNTKIVDNILSNNDVGVYLSNLSPSWSAPDDKTNVKVVNNTITTGSCYNTSYWAAVSDVGNNDKIITNRVGGVTCTTIYNPSGNVIDADASFTNKPKVHATK